MYTDELLTMARRVTRVVADRGGYLGYLHAVDLVRATVTEAAVRPAANGGLTGSVGPPLARALLQRVAATAADISGGALMGSDLLAALEADSRRPRSVVWPDGPAAGVYVTPSWRAAQATLERYAQATGGAAAFTDWSRLRGAGVVDLGRSEDLTRLYAPGVAEYRVPTGVYDGRLAREASGGTLIAVGPIALSEHEGFLSAGIVHQACLLATEYGHRVIVVLRTPQPEFVGGDLRRILTVPEYFDLTYVLTALRGTVTLDGTLVPERLLGQEALTEATRRHALPVRDPIPHIRRKGVGQVAARSQDPSTFHAIAGSPRAARRSGPQHRARSFVPSPPIRPQSRGVPKPCDDDDDRMNGSLAWRESVLAVAAATGDGVAPTSRTDEPDAADSGRAGPVPDGLVSLLHKAAERRRCGVLLVGGRQDGIHRQLLLAHAVSATAAAGPAAIVLPAYEHRSARRFLACHELADGTERVISRAFPDVPVCSSFDSAYGQGYRRVVMECDCEPYRPLPLKTLREHSRDVCFILCSNETEASEVFSAVTSNDWLALEDLIGIFTRSQLSRNPALTLSDGFMPGDRTLNSARYTTASSALFAGRQLWWEIQALQFLHAHPRYAATIRRALRACDMLDADDDGLMRQIARLEGLLEWLRGRIRVRSSPAPVWQRSEHGRPH